MTNEKTDTLARRDTSGDSTPRSAAATVREGSAHYPGPWYVGERSAGHSTDIRATSSRTLIAQVSCGLMAVEANARLIASAPELLASVRFAYESLLRLPIPERIGRQAELIACRDAIAKATGQSDQDVQDFFTAKAWS